MNPDQYPVKNGTKTSKKSSDQMNSETEIKKSSDDLDK